MTCTYTFVFEEEKINIDELAKGNPIAKKYIDEFGIEDAIVALECELEDLKRLQDNYIGENYIGENADVTQEVEAFMNEVNGLSEEEKKKITGMGMKDGKLVRRSQPKLVSRMKTEFQAELTKFFSSNNVEKTGLILNHILNLLPMGGLFQSMVKDIVSLYNQFQKEGSLNNKLGITVNIIGLVLDTVTIAGKSGKIYTTYGGNEGNIPDWITNMIEILDTNASKVIQGTAAAVQGDLQAESRDGGILTSTVDTVNNTLEPNTKPVINLANMMIEKSFKLHNSDEHSDKDAATIEIANDMIRGGVGLLISAFGGGLILPPIAQKCIKDFVVCLADVEDRTEELMAKFEKSYKDLGYSNDDEAMEGYRKGEFKSYDLDFPMY